MSQLVLGLSVTIVERLRHPRPSQHPAWRLEVPATSDRDGQGGGADLRGTVEGRIETGAKPLLPATAAVDGDRRVTEMFRRRLIATVAVIASCCSFGLAQASNNGTPQAAAPHRAHVVIALIGESVNPYQRDFAVAGREANPAGWLPGYPRNSRPLHLDLTEPDLSKAMAHDDKTWRSIKPGQLYFIPGTKFAGVVYLPSPLDRAQSTSFNSDDPTRTLATPRPVVDGYTFHGTGVASVAAGDHYGTCPDCDLVMVAADDPATGLAWAAQQRWIDIISNSWGGPAGVPTQATLGHPQRAAQIQSAASLTAASSGHAVLFASGNGATDLGPTTHGTQHSLTWDSPYAGPPWVLTVGASKAVTEQPTDWHNIPVDVIAQGELRPAADYRSTTGSMVFYGTSCSTPIAAGVLGEALLRARQAVGDFHVGPLNHALLVTTRAIPGPAADRKITYLELFAAAEAVAQWRAFDPSTMTQDPFLTPTTPVAYAYEGYGVLDQSSIAPLTQVLLGLMPAPKRPEMAQWSSIAGQARTALWGPAPSA